MKFFDVIAVDKNKKIRIICDERSRENAEAIREINEMNGSDIYLVVDHGSVSEGDLFEK